MCKKTSVAILCVFFFTMTASGGGPADDPSLVGWWKFDDGAGTVAVDSSKKAADGALFGEPEWSNEGIHGGSLLFDGADDYVFVDGQFRLPIYTMNVWFRVDGGSGNRDILSAYAPGVQHGILLELQGGGTLRYLHRFPLGTGGGTNFYTTDVYDDGAWYHASIVKAPDAITLYINGEVAGTEADTSVFDPGDFFGLALGVLDDERGAARLFVGAMDDLRVYDRVLSPEEIKKAMAGWGNELATNPKPASGGVDLPRDGVLSWAPGGLAVTHDVYLGTVFEDVNTADRANPMDVLVSQSQDANSFDPDGVLAFNQTYYWRVDEVNGAPDNTVFKGDVWSFTAEPHSIPVAAITATASSMQADNMGPENTIGAVGLNELDQHSTEGTEMWLSGMGDATPSIQYEFDQAYKLHELWVWNSNQLIEAFVGLGAKDVVIEYSADGAEWMTLENVPQFAQAPGNASYTANTMVDFGGALAKSVKITINSGYGMLPQYGLSEVRFYYIPTFAREPQPADGDTTAGANVVLSWRAGREAAAHQVYLGTDAAALSLVGTANDNSYDAGALDYDTTYYWQIVEVNEAEIPAAHAGPIWSFVTPAFGTVDSFDQYDDNCNRVFFAWEDGLGHNGGTDIDNCDVPPSNGNGGGSIVGNNTAPFAEQGIVYAGYQSLPFNYDNAFGPSEATLTLDAQDWTASAAQSLSLMFYGEADNSGQLYTKINNSKVVYDGDAGDIQNSQWQPWIIDLSSVGGNLQSVTSLTIGVDGASAAGMLYIDEIRLYPLAAEIITPTEPDMANLLAHYAFDGDSSDSTGNHALTAEGMPVYVPGKEGQAIKLNGVGDYLSVETSIALPSYTAALWLRVEGGTAQRDIMSLYDSAGDFGTLLEVTATGQIRYLHRFPVGASGGNNVYSGPGHDDGAWYHVAAVKTESSMSLFINGQLVGSVDDDTQYETLQRITLGVLLHDNLIRYFPGELDEVYLYGRVLSQAEVAWLAGMTTPFAKPF
jgi:hypothetical protein